jgi:hypothetical protein
MKRRAWLSFSLGLMVLIGYSSALVGEEWVSIGPFGLPLPNQDIIDGQANVVAVDPRNAQVLYLGTAEGGVWKTANGGQSWTPMTDMQLVRTQWGQTRKGTGSIGALAIDPSAPDTIYAGTGDPNVACCDIGPGLGVFRSRDGGVTWAPLGAAPDQSGCANGSMGVATVYRLVVVPGSTTTLLAATDMGLFRYREDASDCWQSLSSGVPAAWASDLVMDSFHGALYAAFPGSGLFKSSDVSGNQWSALAGGFPSPAGTPYVSRIALAFAGRTGVGFTNPLPMVYAGFSLSDETYRLFVTQDGGSTWTELASPPHDGQLEFNTVIAVGSYSSNEVYIGQIALWRALDGGQQGGENDYKAQPPVTSQSWNPLSCCQTQPNPQRRGLDLHADIHDIEFAPFGSFTPSPSQLQLVFVANDGGLTQGRVDSNGVVTWEPLSRGLAVGQAQYIGLSAGDPTVSASGFWHNGNALLLPTLQQQLPVGGGDGQTARIDAGSGAIYYDCNIGFGASLCRSPPPAGGTISPGDTIWSTSSRGVHWTDPYRPGNLLRLDASTGLVFRTTIAGQASTSTLNSPDSWQAVDPFWGKTGKTVTMTFRSRLLEDQPVYYLGTDSGQVWRGSPEVGWSKVCECGNAKVLSIAGDLLHDERIFVALDGATSPGRIKELARSADGSWTMVNIDTTFQPEVTVDHVTSIVVDPVPPVVEGTVVYVGTDQGVYQGSLEEPVVAAFADRVTMPTPFDQWTWRRSPGVPYVWTNELQVHQSVPSGNRTGIIRAATYGRGLYELNRNISPIPWPRPPFTITVQAMQSDGDGPAHAIPAPIVTIWKGESHERRVPFEIAPEEPRELILDAPVEVRTADAVLAFRGWVLPNGERSAEHRVTLKAKVAGSVVAYYEEARPERAAGGKPLQLAASAHVRSVCLQPLTHLLEVSWNADEGTAPRQVQVEINYANGQRQQVVLKPDSGTRSFPLHASSGKRLLVYVRATDSTGQAMSRTLDLEMRPCRK